MASSLKQKSRDAETADIEYKEQEQIKKGYAYIGKIAAYVLCGFCLSQLEALGEMSPFAAAFLGCVNFDFCAPTFISAAVGYFISSPWKRALKYTVICSLCCLIRLLVHKRLAHREGTLQACLTAFFPMMAVGTAYAALSGITVTAVLMCLCESLLSACACIFFCRSMKTPIFSLGINGISAKDTTGLLLSLGIFLMSMSGFTLEGISPARILASLAVMFFALYKGSAAGCVAGVCVGAALAVDPSYRYVFSCFAVAGLVCGVFASLGQIITSAAYGIAFAAVCLMGLSGDGIFLCLIEAAIACAAFMLIPAKAITSLQEAIEKSGVMPDNRVSREISEKLKTAAENIYSVSKIVCDVSEKLDKVINPEVNRLFASLQQKVCVGCQNKGRCWKKDFDSTARDVMALAGIEKKGKNRLPIEKRCPRLELLREHIEYGCADYANSMAMKNKVSDMRRALTDQFNGMGDFLSGFAEKISCSRVEDPAKSVALRTALRDAGVKIDALSYMTGSDGRVTLELTFLEKTFDTDRKKTKTLLEFVTKKRLSEPAICVTDIKTTVTYEEKAAYEVHFGCSQKPLWNGGMCGDAVAFIDSPDGTKTALISDGMGTGARAAIDSSMTASIAQKLISCGFSFKEAVKIINSAMIMKSTDESIATLDAVSINTFNGNAEFFKSGAAATFLRRGNEITLIEKESLPIGIIRGISPARESVKLTTGDIILLVSDGVTAGDSGWINDELLAWNTASMEDLAEHIANLAKLRSDKNTRDDITAAAVKILRAK